MNSISNLPKWFKETKIVFFFWLSTRILRLEDVHVRNQRNDNERYLAKWRSNGDKRKECFVVDITVGNNDDNSNVDKR
jgi:hypothetical protein